MLDLCDIHTCCFGLFDMCDDYTKKIETVLGVTVNQTTGYSGWLSTGGGMERYVCIAILMLCTIATLVRIAKGALVVFLKSQASRLRKKGALTWSVVIE